MMRDLTHCFSPSRFRGEVADVAEVYLDLNVLTHSIILLYEYVCVPLGGTGIGSCAVLRTKGIAGLSQLQV